MHHLMNEQVHNDPIFQAYLLQVFLMADTYTLAPNFVFILFLWDAKKGKAVGLLLPPCQATDQ